MNNQETMSMAIFRERSKSRFCIGPAKRPFTEINHVTVLITRKENKRANHACSSAKSLAMNKQMKAKMAACDLRERK